MCNLISVPTVGPTRYYTYMYNKVMKFSHERESSTSADQVEYIYHVNIHNILYC